MNITRIYADTDGESRFQEIDIPIADAGDIGHLSKTIPAKGIIFRETTGDYDYAWHNAPRRQYVIILQGDVEITVSSGEMRRFTGGDVLLLEDTQGKGHYSKAVEGMPRKSIFVALE